MQKRVRRIRFVRPHLLFRSSYFIEAPAQMQTLLLSRNFHQKSNPLFFDVQFHVGILSSLLRFSSRGYFINASRVRAYCLPSQKSVMSQLFADIGKSVGKDIKSQLDITHTERLNELLLKQNLRRTLLTCQRLGTKTNRQTVLCVQRDCENMRGHETKLVAVRI